MAAVTTPTIPNDYGQGGANIAPGGSSGPASLALATVLQAIKTDLATLDGSRISTLADGATTPGLLCVHTKNIADAATADYDIVLDVKEEVVDVVVQKRANAGGAANTVQVKNGANAITDAISININDAALARAASVDDANSTIAAAGTLRITVTKAGGNAACFVTVYTVRRT